MNKYLLFVQAFSLNSTANICRLFDICKYFYKFFSSFLQINFYVFVFQRFANIERKKKIQLFTFTQIYKGLTFLYRFGCAFVGVASLYICGLPLRFCRGYLSKNANIFTLRVLKNLILCYCSGFLSPFELLIKAYEDAPRKGLQVVANCAKLHLIPYTQIIQKVAFLPFWSPKIRGKHF